MPAAVLVHYIIIIFGDILEVIIKLIFKKISPSALVNLWTLFQYIIIGFQLRK